MLALAAVWAFTGLWHGASWNYLCWGLYFGVLVIAEKLFWGKWLKRLPAWLGWVYTALATVVSFVLCGGQTLKESGEILKGMFCLQAAGAEGIYAFWNYGGTLLLSLIAALCKRSLQRKSLPVESTAYAGVQEIDPETGERVMLPSKPKMRDKPNGLVKRLFDKFKKKS